MTKEERNKLDRIRKLFYGGKVYILAEDSDKLIQISREEALADVEKIIDDSFIPDERFVFFANQIKQKLKEKAK